MQRLEAGEPWCDRCGCIVGHHREVEAENEWLRAVIADFDPDAEANLAATWNGRDGKKCPEPNCDGEKDHGGKHFAWMAD